MVNLWMNEWLSVLSAGRKQITFSPKNSLINFLVECMNEKCMEDWMSECMNECISIYVSIERKQITFELTNINGSFTVSPWILDPIYVVTCYIKWVKTSWADSW